MVRIAYSALMSNAGRSGHKQFSFDELVAVAVIGQQHEIIYCQNRFDSRCHSIASFAAGDPTAP
jgi:hypothetical protein